MDGIVTRVGTADSPEVRYVAVAGADSSEPHAGVVGPWSGVLGQGSGSSSTSNASSSDRARSSAHTQYRVTNETLLNRPRQPQEQLIDPKRSTGSDLLGS